MTIIYSHNALQHPSIIRVGMTFFSNVFLKCSTDQLTSLRGPTSTVPRSFQPTTSIAVERGRSSFFRGGARVSARLVQNALISPAGGRYDGRIPGTYPDGNAFRGA